jgi:hypothetical protein
MEALLVVLRSLYRVMKASPRKVMKNYPFPETVVQHPELVARLALKRLGEPTKVRIKGQTANQQMP